jgi:seryl-tRNA synthetase
MASMPNIATLLKSEISRVARKELRSETLSLKKATRTYRSEIAALKRRMQELEHQLRRMNKSTAKASPVEDESATAEGLRFSAKGLISQRKRLGSRRPSAGYWSVPLPSRSTTGKLARSGLAPSTWPPSRAFGLWESAKSLPAWLLLNSKR